MAKLKRALSDVLDKACEGVLNMSDEELFGDIDREHKVSEYSVKLSNIYKKCLEVRGYSFYHKDGHVIADNEQFCIRLIFDGEYVHYMLGKFCGDDLFQYGTIIPNSNNGIMISLDNHLKIVKSLNSGL